MTSMPSWNLTPPITFGNLRSENSETSPTASPQGKEDMKARTLLLTIALVALSSQAYARGMLCGEFARHNLVSSDPGSKYNLACNWRDWGRASSAQVGDLVFRPSSPRWQDRRTLQWQDVPGQVRQ